jgi:hypothetical protein
MHATRLIFLALTVATGALALSACGKSVGERAAEAAIEAKTGQKAEVDADSGTVTMKTEQGEMKIASGDAAKLPANFPKDVYLPADYKVESAMEMPNAFVLNLDAPGQPKAMFEEAGKRMAAEGWKQSMSMQQDAVQIAVYEKDKRNATFSVSDNPGKGVKLNVQVTQQQ